MENLKLEQAKSMLSGIDIDESISFDYFDETCVFKMPKKRFIFKGHNVAGEVVHTVNHNGKNMVVSCIDDEFIHMYNYDRMTQRTDARLKLEKVEIICCSFVSNPNKVYEEYED